MKLADIKTLKFVIVGVINTIVGSIIMFLLYNSFHCSYWISTVTNYVLTSILSYVLNKKFTFQDQSKVTNSLLKFVVNIAVCYLAAYGIAKPLVILLLSHNSTRVVENIAMLVGMVLFTGFNYIGQRFFVFSQKKD